jgi:site-specific DNA-methyltransferase (adenine-specific)
MKHHPITRLFPPMSEAQYAGLRDSVAAIGLLEPGWTWQGDLIDGIHRERACKETGREFRTREWDGQGSLTEFVAALNKDRRHLSDDQRVAIAVDIAESLAEEGRKAQQEGRKKGGETAGRSRPKANRSGANLPQTKGKPPPPEPRAPRSRDKAAKQMGVKPRRVQAQKTIKAKNPRLHEKVKRGEVTHARAQAELRREKKLEELKAKAEAASTSPEPIGNWQITLGDCLTALAEIAPGTIRLAFADPPYNQGIDYGSGSGADRLSDEDYLAWCQQWMNAVARTLTSDGSFWVLISDEYADHFGLLLRKTGMHRRQWLIWYESFGVCDGGKRSFTRSSRHLFWCVKDARNYVFNEKAVTRPSARQTVYKDKRADPEGRTWDSIWGIDPPLPRLVGTAAERIPGFPTQLPVALLLAIVGCASNPGDLVLDPFSGSATTGMAALRLGRSYLGIEKEAQNASLSSLRLQGEANG